MVTLEKMIAFLEELAPLELAEAYDNVGLMAGDPQAKIGRVMLSLDTDIQVVREAAEKNCELIVSHHPILFHPLKRLNIEDNTAGTLIEAIRSNINLYACHTNLDSVTGGLCDYLLARLGISGVRHSLTDAGKMDGIGRVAVLERAVTLSELLERIKNALGLSSLRFVGNPDDLVKTVGICNGGGGDMVFDAYQMGCDVYLSGDFKHHHGRFAYENNLSLIEITHYDAERCFCDLMAEKLRGRFDVDVFKSETEHHVWEEWR